MGVIQFRIHASSAWCGFCKRCRCKSKTHSRSTHLVLVEDHRPLRIESNGEQDCEPVPPRLSQSLGVLRESECMPADDGVYELIAGRGVALQLDPVQECAEHVSELYALCASMSTLDEQIRICVREECRWAGSLKRRHEVEREVLATRRSRHGWSI